MTVDGDPFDDLFNLESTYESEGYHDGLRDGRAQAHTSALLFGLEKGFEKYMPMTQVRAKVEAWAERHNVAIRDETKVSGNQRLEKHIKTLLALTDPNTLSYANTDEAVGDFDERLKRALAKVKVIERILGEEAKESPTQVKGNGPPNGDDDIENPRLNATALKNLKI